MGKGQVEPINYPACEGGRDIGEGKAAYPSPKRKREVAAWKRDFLYLEMEKTNLRKYTEKLAQIIPM